MRIPLAVLFILISASFAAAHGEEVEASSRLFGLEPLNVIYIASLLIFAVTLIALAFPSHLNDWEKKIAFLVIALSTVFATVYVVADTAYLNLASESKGPVHWHADMKITICGEVQSLPSPSSWLDNKVGTNVLHHHNEGAEQLREGLYRIHVEGVVKKLHDVELAKFFEAIGGYLAEDSVGIPTAHGGIKAWTNGELCPDGHAGTLKVFVNGEPNDEFGEYVIAPYSTVPPGDFIELVFD